MLGGFRRRTTAVYSKLSDAAIPWYVPTILCPVRRNGVCRSASRLSLPSHRTVAPPHTLRLGLMCIVAWHTRSRPSFPSPSAFQRREEEAACSASLLSCPIPLNSTEYPPSGLIPLVSYQRNSPLLSQIVAPFWGCLELLATSTLYMRPSSDQTNPSSQATWMVSEFQLTTNPPNPPFPSPQRINNLAEQRCVPDAEVRARVKNPPPCAISSRPSSLLQRSGGRCCISQECPQRVIVADWTRGLVERVRTFT